MSLLLPLSWKLALVRLVSPLSAPRDFPHDGPRLIVALAADYGNLGDVALTRALIELSGRHLPRHRPCLLPAGRLFRELRGVSRHLSPEDVIAIVGGGNMGDLYPDLEEARQQVVRKFRHHRIISFPQSIDFSDNEEGRSALRRARRVYQSHPGLTLFARDAESFQIMKSAFPGVAIGLTPDTVLSMAAPTSLGRDIPVITCLREDKEAGLSAARRADIVAEISQAYPGCVITDTIVSGARLDYSSYDHRLGELLGKFARSRCVVTDRLHGLIFSVITSTPCVVIENNNHKISALVRTWLSDLPSIRLLSNPTPAEVAAAIDDLRDINATRPDLSAGFAPLVTALRG